MSLDVEMLAEQISRAFRGESWHGPSVLEVLAGGSAGEGAALAGRRVASHAGVQFGGLARKPARLGGTEPTAAACRARLPGGTPSAAAGLRVLGVHPVRRHAAARPVSRGSGRPTQEGTRGLARGGLT